MATPKTKTKSSKPKNTSQKLRFLNVAQDLRPLEVSEAASTSSVSTRSRRNKSAIDQFKKRYPNIDDGLVPYKYTSSVTNSSNITIKDAVELVQKAYYNFAILRNTVDLMTEFSISHIYYEGGTKKSRALFETLFTPRDLWSLQDKFFREYFRSGNVFLYRFDAEVDLKDVTRLNSILKTSAEKITIPSRYIVLNPCDIEISGGLNFTSSVYFKVLNGYELEVLRNPRTEQDKLVFDNLPDETRKKIKRKGGNEVVLLPLDKEKILAIFYKKQDYEPFAVPFAFPTLDSIEFKLEMRKMDLATMRQIQQSILLITMGAELKDGSLYIDQKQKEAMQTLLENQSVARVIIADYTTEAKFVIPDVAQILDPKKYEEVDRDIREGLSSLFSGTGEKFANQNIKVEVFLERLRQSREAFIYEFYIPEMERIAKQLNLRNIPTPKFVNDDFRDKAILGRIYTRLAELGILTPNETIQALKDGRLPDTETSLEDQEQSKQWREEGFYEPIIGGGSRQGGDGGRPEGTNTPQTTKEPSPMGESQGYSLSKIKENLNLARELDSAIKDKLKERYRIKRFSREQYQLMDEIASIIVANEKPKVWKKKIDSYIDNPVDRNQERVGEVTEISTRHGVNSYLGAILYHSRK